jgi:seryl-tRNA synthetase
MRQVGDRITAMEGELQPVQERLDAALLEVPNMPDPSVPVGPAIDNNVVVRQERRVTHAGV